jgi:preprotein translocase subunit Sec63
VTPVPDDIARCFNVLKVPRDASPLAIRKAYRVLSQKHHPDRNREDPHAADRMAEINRAYAVLCNPRREIEHDQWTVQHSGRVDRVRTWITRAPRKQLWYIIGAAVAAIGCVIFTPPFPHEEWLGHAWRQSSASPPTKAATVTDVEIADGVPQHRLLLDTSLSLHRSPAGAAASLPPAAQGLP